MSQLLDIVTGFGGFIVPLVLWLTQRDAIMNMDENGKSIINFQIGIGILGIIAVAVLCFVFPIVNAIKVSNGEKPHYPLSIKFV